MQPLCKPTSTKRAAAFCTPAFQVAAQAALHRTARQSAVSVHVAARRAAVHIHVITPQADLQFFHTVLHEAARGALPDNIPHALELQLELVEEPLHAGSRDMASERARDIYARKLLCHPQR